MELLDGKVLKDFRLNKLKEEIAFRKENGIDAPGLAVIQVGHVPESDKYVNNKINAANLVGINLQHFECDSNTTNFERLRDLIFLLNKDSKINGIFIQIPIPNEYLHKREEEIINLISAVKDVDGLTTVNLGKLITKEEGLFPCTAVGIMMLFDYYNIDLSHKNVTVIGRSNLVGRPLAELLTNKDATVTLCHSKTDNLKEHTVNADIVVSAVGKPRLITEDMISEGSIVVDAGTTFKDGRLYGDVDFDNVSKKASFISKVPGGVGQTTVLALMENTLKAQKLQKKR